MHVPGEEHPLTVLVCGIHEDHYPQVVLVDSRYAGWGWTNRDVLLSETVSGVSWGLMVCIDLVVTADPKFLGDRVLLTIDPEVAEEFFFAYLEEDLKVFAERCGGELGSLVPQWGDYVWRDRGRLARQLQRVFCWDLVDGVDS